MIRNGIQINYYYVCKRKLWLYSKGIRLEKENERVLHGSLIHEYTYQSKQNKELYVDNLLKFDILDEKYVREVKLSSKMPIPGIM